MSLAVARYIACSAMMTAQTQSAVAAANIANADTSGYTTKTANQAAQVTGGVGSGVAVTDITSNVDRLLFKSLMTAVCDLGSASTKSDYLDRLQSVFGSTTGSDDDTGTSLANTLATLEAALTSLADTPDSASLAATVVDDLDAVASQLRSTSSSVQSLRANADEDIDSSVDSANEVLHTIADLNHEITQAAAAGLQTADMEDERNSALQTLSSLMNVTYFANSSGEMQVYTSSGQVLLDTSVHELSYTTASSVTASTTYSATPPSGFSGIVVDGKDITSQTSSGKIGALVTLRDDTLPQVQSELDELATTLADSLNAVHNQGTPVPPSSSLSGTTTVASSDTLAATGTVRIAVTDQDGKLVSYSDLDLSSYATVGDLVSAVDGLSGTSASIDADGHVVISADGSGNGIAINELDSSVGGEGFSDWLGLNDLVGATGASDFAVRSDILSNSSLLATSTLDSSSSLTVGATVVSSGSAVIANDLYDSLTGKTAFSAAGSLGATRTSFANYAADVVADVAARAKNADSVASNKKLIEENISSSVSSQSGVNVDEETARLSELQNSYSAAAQIIQTLNSMFSALLDAVQSAG
jgi:flagellar hook-associated protein 1 FlgK